MPATKVTNKGKASEYTTTLYYSFYCRDLLTDKMEGITIKNKAGKTVKLGAKVAATDLPLTIKRTTDDPLYIEAICHSGKYVKKTKKTTYTQLDITTVRFWSNMIADCTVEMGEDPGYYNETSAHKPAVTVLRGQTPLIENWDYKVTYSSSTTGTGKVTVTGINNYCGQVTKTFTVAGPKISSVKNTAKSKATVKWGKVADASGYELQYGLKSSFSGAKTVKITKVSTVSKVISKLKKGKTYYFRIRAYQTQEDGKKLYSAYSAPKKAAIKK